MKSIFQDEAYLRESLNHCLFRENEVKQGEKNGKNSKTLSLNGN
jgi:hypothetical protein